jgi:hypothetical protein
MCIKYIKLFHSKGFKNVPKLRVWFENKPSGNPAQDPNQTTEGFGARNLIYVKIFF